MALQYDGPSWYAKQTEKGLWCQDKKGAEEYVQDVALTKKPSQAGMTYFSRSMMYTQT